MAGYSMLYIIECLHLHGYLVSNLYISEEAAPCICVMTIYLLQQTACVCVCVCQIKLKEIYKEYLITTMLSML